MHKRLITALVLATLTATAPPAVAGIGTSPGTKTRHDAEMEHGRAGGKARSYDAEMDHGRTARTASAAPTQATTWMPACEARPHHPACRPPRP